MNEICSYCGGACCQYIILPAHFNFKDREAVKWLNWHGIEKTKDGTLFKQSCQHYNIDTGLCRIHGKRPITCRKFPVGGTHCLKSIKRIYPDKLPFIKKMLEERK